MIPRRAWWMVFRAAFSAAAFRINSPALSAQVGFWSGIRPRSRRRASDRYHRWQLAGPLDSATVVTRGMSAIPSMAAARVAAGVTSLTGQKRPSRIGLMGDSAGAHLAALVALAPDQFAAEYRGDPNAAVSANMKAVIGFYGVYDMLAQWQHDQIARPTNSIAEKFLGTSLIQNRRVYFD